MIRVEIDHDAYMTYIRVRDEDIDRTVSYKNASIDLDSDGNICGVELYTPHATMVELG